MRPAIASFATVSQSWGTPRWLHAEAAARLHSWKKKVRLADHPGFVRFMMFEPPGRISGRPREEKTYSVRFIDAHIFPDINARLARLGSGGFEDNVTINGMVLARLVAKIGHSFAVAELGFDVFEEMYAAHLV